MWKVVCEYHGWRRSGLPFKESAMFAGMEHRLERNCKAKVLVSQEEEEATQ